MRCCRFQAGCRARWKAPTPSSAVYYGSLSIHAGCFLLLRSAPLLEQAPGRPSPGRRPRRGDGGVRGHCDARAERREVVARVRLADAGRHHRRRNRDRLVHDRVHPSGRARLLPAAAVPQRAERPPRSARDGGGHWQPPVSGQLPRSRHLGSRPSASVPDRARTRIPRQHPGPCCRGPLHAARAAADAPGRMAVRRRGAAAAADRVRGGRGSG